MSDDSESVYTTFQSGKQSVVEAKPLQNNNKWNTFSNKRSTYPLEIKNGQISLSEHEL